MRIKSIIYFFAIIAFSACETSLDEPLSPSSHNAYTSTKSIESFNPIDELRGIPVNIINCGNTKNKFLSARPSGYDVVVYNQDDGSQRQRWYVNSSSISLLGGNESVWPPIYLGIYNTTFDEPWPMLSEMGCVLSFTPIPGTPYYFISVYNYYRKVPAYLQSSTSTGTGLQFKITGSKTDLGKWEIRPVGEFKVIDIEYFKTESDVFTRKDQIIADALIENDRDEPITYHFTVNGSANESSNFSKAEGVSTSISENNTSSIPNIDSSSSLTENHNSNASWDFGTSESKAISVQHSVDIPIPARTKCKVEALVVSHKATVSYIATLQSTSNNNTFRIKGKWSGITTSTFYCKITNESTNKLIGIYEF